MSQLRQMQITFVPVQDRLLFRLNTQGRPSAEFRFWFTRRYVRLLWDSLIKMLKKMQPLEVESSQSPPAQEAVKAAQAATLAVEHKEVIAQADFKTAYEESQVFPLGPDPILAVKVAIKEGPMNNQVLCIHPEEGQGLEMALNKQLLHSFCQLLVQGSQKGAWELPLNFGEAEDLISKRMLN